MSVSERRLVFDCVAYPEEREGEELAKNFIAYRRLTDAGPLDPSQGSYALFMGGKFIRYGPQLSEE